MFHLHIHTAGDATPPARVETALGDGKILKGLAELFKTVWPLIAPLLPLLLAKGEAAAEPTA